MGEKNEWFCKLRIWKDLNNNNNNKKKKKKKKKKKTANPLKKDYFSVRNIGKPEVAFVFAV